VFADLSIGEKIRLIRKDRGYSLENVAKDANCSIATISRLERSETDVDDVTMYAIRRALGVEKAPLTTPECEQYMGRMMVWGQLMSSLRIDEARAMVTEMSAILQLPYERSLSLLYTQMEIRLLCHDICNMPLVKKMLAESEHCFDEMGEDAHHLFFSNKGLLAYQQEDFRNALKYMFTALTYQCQVSKGRESDLFTYIGMIYLRMARIHFAIMYFEQARQAFGGDLTNPALASIETNLATGYIQIGEFEKGRVLVENALAHARRTNLTVGIGISYCNLAEIQRGKGDLDEAIRHVDNSLYQLKNMGAMYMIPLYYKTIYLYELKRTCECLSLAKEGLALAKADGSELFILQFETQCHLATLKDPEAENFIENIAIPRLRELYELNYALYYCEKLEEHYKKKKSGKKALTMAAIARDIYKEMFSAIDYDTANA